MRQMSLTFASLLAPGCSRKAAIFIAHVCAISCSVSHVSTVRLLRFVFSFAPERVTNTLRCVMSMNARLQIASSTTSPAAPFPNIGVIYAARASFSARSITLWSICNETENPLLVYSCGVIFADFVN